MHFYPIPQFKYSNFAKSCEVPSSFLSSAKFGKLQRTPSKIPNSRHDAMPNRSSPQPFSICDTDFPGLVHYRGAFYRGNSMVISHLACNSPTHAPCFPQTLRTHGNVHFMQPALDMSYRRFAYLHQPALDRNDMPEDGWCDPIRTFASTRTVLLLFIVISYVRLMLGYAFLLAVCLSVRGLMVPSLHHHEILAFPNNSCLCPPRNYREVCQSMFSVSASSV